MDANRRVVRLATFCCECVFTSLLVNLGKHSADVGRVWPACGQFQPSSAKLGQVWSDFVNIPPMCANVGQVSADCGRNWTNPGSSKQVFENCVGHLLDKSGTRWVCWGCFSRACVAQLFRNLLRNFRVTYVSLCALPGLSRAVDIASLWRKWEGG